MHYDDQNYRLAPEASNPALQVTHGCSYGKCSFCSLYGKMKFSMASQDEILQDLDELSKIQGLKRLYLTNGDPFCLASDKLIWIMDKARERIPSLETFTMFASILNIKSKTDGELEKLRQYGISDLYIGIENFSDHGLKVANKGYDKKEAMDQIKRLKDFGYGVNIMLIPGIRGKGFGEESGYDNAEALNIIQPGIITFTGLMVVQASKLWNDIRKGIYERSTYYDNILEMKTFFEHIKLENSYFYSFYPIGTDEVKRFIEIKKASREDFKYLFEFFGLKGYLPKEKEKGLEICTQILERFSQRDLALLDRLRPFG